MHIKLGGFFQLTVATHSDGKTFFKTTVLATITIQTDHQAFTVTQTTILDLFLDAASKKTLEQKFVENKCWRRKNKKKRNKNYLAALTRCYAVMVARRFVAANLARNKRFNGGRRRCGRCRTDAAGRRRCNGSRIKITRKVLF